ncbi:hypothetical protein [Gilvimarinus algae]|uniref:Flagellar protein FliT n=1 Tax=Gilvimarinus algae TaxID=3058037 RepID=A0ABT8TJS6_9GAMM|nr:hypothetical protein [Gilvimarinus sp. SDUM040014]MDO3382602.1 hypothetical protein [Gilvimarinus sp. SDUM040014]
MSLSLVEADSLAGPGGFEQLRQLQTDMSRALAVGDYTRVRQLDETCAVLLDKLIAANRENRSILLESMMDLKALYAQMIQESERLARAACS